MGALAPLKTSPLHHRLRKLMNLFTTFVSALPVLLPLIGVARPAHFKPLSGKVDKSSR